MMKIMMTMTTMTVTMVMVRMTIPRTMRMIRWSTWSMITRVRSGVTVQDAKEQLLLMYIIYKGVFHAMECSFL